MTKTIEQEMADSEEALKAVIEQRDKISEKHFAQVALPEMRRRIGKCYRYRNSAGGDDCWWMYTRIIGIGEYDYTVVNVSNRPSGIVEIKITDGHSGKLPDMMHGYEEISDAVFRKETRNTLAKATNAVLMTGRKPRKVKAK